MLEDEARAGHAASAADWSPVEGLGEGVDLS